MKTSVRRLLGYWVPPRREPRAEEPWGWDQLVAVTPSLFQETVERAERAVLGRLLTLPVDYPGRTRT